LIRYLANSIFDQGIEVEVDQTGQLAPPPVSNPKDKESTSSDAERLLATETSSSQPVYDVQPLSTSVSPLSPDPAHAPSPDLQGTPGPSKSLDYYQAIGRAARSGDVRETIVRFNPESLCRRLHPVFFLVLVLPVRCYPMRNRAMLSHAQPCEICSAQFMCKQSDQWPPHIIEAVAPPALPSPDMRKQLALLPDPLEQPDSLLSSATNLAAGNSCLELPRTEELGGFVRTVGDNLAKACVNCWSNGLEDYSHLLDECRLKPFELRSGENGAKPYGSLLGVASIAVVPERFVRIVYAIVVCSSHLCLDIGIWPKASSS
jgi:hypothetical protein